MQHRPISRRAVLVTGAALAARPALAATAPIRFLTNWYAQAEHGGFYQAQATGLYQRAGVNVEIDMGGPELNNLQLLLAGRYDVVISGPEQVLQGIQRGLPLVAIATSFQKSLTGLMTHPDITDLSQLKHHPILISAGERFGFWPWLARKYGFSDDQVHPYTFNLQPFLFNPAVAIQSYATSEPYAARERGIKFRFFLFSDLGYTSYENLLVTTRPVLATRSHDLAAFLGASTQGWKDFLTGDPASAEAAIISANPNMTRDQIIWSIGEMKRIQAVGAPGSVIGRMDDAHWARIQKIVAATGMIPASMPWRSAYSQQLAGAMTATV